MTGVRGPVSYTPQVNYSQCECKFLPSRTLSYAFCLLFVCVCIAPMPVQVAVPLSVGTDYAQLYIQPPRAGLIDGVKVCACPGVCDSMCKGSCEYLCDWHSLPADTHIITITSLSPGSEYQLSVYSTSREQMGPPYPTRPIRTSELSDTELILLSNVSLNQAFFTFVQQLRNAAQTIRIWAGTYFWCFML